MTANLADRVEGLDPDYALAVAAGWTRVERDPSPDRCEDGPVWHHAELDRAMPLDTSCRDLCREVGADDEEGIALLRAKAAGGSDA